MNEDERVAVEWSHLVRGAYAEECAEKSVARGRGGCDGARCCRLAPRRLSVLHPSGVHYCCSWFVFRGKTFCFLFFSLFATLRWCCVVIRAADENFIVEYRASNAGVDGVREARLTV